MSTTSYMAAAFWCVF